MKKDWNYVHNALLIQFTNIARDLRFLLFLHYCLASVLAL